MTDTLNSNLEQSIHESLDNAVTNGYPLNTWRVEAIVMDLQRCDADGEKHATAVLDPIVRSWLAKQPVTHASQG